MVMKLVIRRMGEESWRDVVMRCAKAQGLEHECLELYDDLCLSGTSEEKAAWVALYEWDCVPYEEVDKARLEEEK